MSPRLRIITFVLGAALFALLIDHAGPAQLFANLRRAGWVLLPICLLWIPVYMCRAAAWRVCMGRQPGRPGFWRTVAISSVTYAVNLITPFVQAGGELLRVSAMTPYLGAGRATGSTIAYYMLHAISNMLLWLAGIVALLLWVPLSAPLVVAFALAGVVIVGLIWFAFARHQYGVVAPVLRIVQRIPLVRRLARPLAQHQARIEELDQVITGFYHDSPRRFFLALAVDTLGRLIALGEYWLAAWAIGITLSAAQTLIIGAVGALVVNVIFFVPLEVGVKEGGLFAVFQLLGLVPALGVFAAIVQRLREFVWIAVGLLCIPLAGGRATQQSYEP